VWTWPVELPVDCPPCRSAEQSGALGVFASRVPRSIDHRDGERVGGSALISNESAVLTVELEPGEYTYYSTPHRAAGMTGTLTVS